MLLLIVPWLAGMVLAKGFWSTAVAVMLPPCAIACGLERRQVERRVKPLTSRVGLNLR